GDLPAEFADVALGGRKGVFHFEIDVLERLNAFAARRGKGSADVVNADFIFLSFHGSPRPCDAGWRRLLPALEWLTAQPAATEREFFPGREEARETEMRQHQWQ